MIYVRKPTDREYAELQKMVRWEVGRVSQRALIILLSGRRKQVPELAEFFGVSRATIRLWIHRFDQHGVVGLYDEERCGRPHHVQAN